MRALAFLLAWPLVAGQVRIYVANSAGNDVTIIDPRRDVDAYDAIRNQAFDPAGWHHYKMTWLPGSLRIEVDGRQVAAWSDHIPDEPMGFGGIHQGEAGRYPHSRSREPRPRGGGLSAVGRRAHRR